MIRALAIAVLSLATIATGMVACHPECPPCSTAVIQPTGPEPPVEETDAAPWTPCRRSCFQLKKLGCPEAERVPSGETCTATCQKLVDTGVSGHDPQCIIDAKTQEDVRHCNVRCGAK